MSAKLDALGPTAHSTERIHETLAEKLHEVAAMISSSTETSKQALADTKLSAELVQEDTRNKAQTNLRELLGGENGALREALRKEFEHATQAISSNCAESVAKIIEVKECEKQSSLNSINRERILALSRINIRRHEIL